jgi:beta-glucosidase/6-phospho-beta-glucosidase/beta-galactosidase
VAPGVYDWSFTDLAFNEMKRLGITPIVDLCHFGVPDWIGSFQNPDFPVYFAQYAQAFAKRFPYLRHYTPVNEIFIAAMFSAQYGWWNERKKNEHSFVNAIRNLCKANLMAMEAILQVQPKAVFIQAESCEYFHAQDPSCQAQADFLNMKRFLAMDITTGYPMDPAVRQYLLNNGMTSASGDLFGYYVIARQYYQRYRLPLMHTETNMKEPRAVEWLHKQWANLYRLKMDNIPVIGFTWYSLIDQVDWDTALREDNGNINSLGLYDMDRNIRPVGEAYKQLISQWSGILADNWTKNQHSLRRQAKKAVEMV